MNKKYPRTQHSPISLSNTADDKFMSSGYLSQFLGKELILSEKLDGQNCCISKHGVFARTHSQTSNHKWDRPIIERWETMKNDLGDLELFGENMVAIHSIEYQGLESYFYLFGIRENNRWLSWEEVKFYADLFDFPTPPEIQIQFDLAQFSNKNENVQLESWLKANLNQEWTDYIKTGGALNGIEVQYNQNAIETKVPTCEGFVIRDSQELFVNDDNVFTNLFKIVRPNHIQTDKNWANNYKTAKLINYEKYHWENQRYLTY